MSWSTIPKPGSTASEQLAEQLNLCARATDEADRITGQVLRATVDTEQEFGPGSRLTVNMSNAWARLVVSRWPVLQLVSAQVSPATGAPTWMAIPPSALLAEHPSLGVTGTLAPDGAGAGPQAILVAPGYVDWWNGRDGYILSVTYVNGWPVAGIDQTASQGATSIHVDDITGWLGVRGVVHDGAQRETLTVTGVSPDTAGATSGSGTLTISPALAYQHTPPSPPASTVLFSSMPESIILACIYLATAQALVRGATAVTAQQARGSMQSGGSRTVDEWQVMAEAALVDYQRVW